MPATAQGRAVHDGGVQFIAPLGGENRAAPGIKQRIVLQHTRHGLDNVQRAFAVLQQQRAYLRDLCQGAAIDGLLRSAQSIAADHAGAAMQGQGPGFS